MVDGSSRMLAALLIVAVMISLAGTLISLNRFGGMASLTGRATSSTANITISATAGIDVTNNIDLGTGTVNGSGGIFNVSSNFTTNWNETFGFNPCHPAVADVLVCGGMQIQNTGNVDVNVTFNISEDAASFIGGSSPLMTWSASIGNASYASNGCGATAASGNLTDAPGLTGGYGEWLTLNANVTNAADLANNTVCSNLTWEAGQDSVSWQINVSIPADAPAGFHTTTLEFIASQV